MFVCSAASDSHQHRETRIEIEGELGIQVQDTVLLIRKVHPEIMRQSKMQVRARLRSVLWREGVCDVLHDGIWRVVESMRGGNMVPA